MRVSEVEAFLCRAVFREPIWSLQPWRDGRYRWADRLEFVLVRVTSSDGLVGYGEARGVRFKGPEIVSVGEECKRLVEKVVAPELVGRDPLDSGVLWGDMRRKVDGEIYGNLALSGVDVALWDLKGKALDVPVYTLLGGKYRSRVRLYASKVPGIIDPKSEDEAETLAKRLNELLKEGYTAFKLGGGLGLEADLRSVEIARETVGEDCKIMLDAGCAYGFEEAVRLGKKLQKFGVEWFEAPLRPSDLDGYVRLASELDLKVATDVHPKPRQVAELLSRGKVDVFLSDVTSSGGITASKMIADLTGLRDVEFSTHAGWHITGVGYAASVHLSAAVPNLNFQEGRIHYDANPFGNAILAKPLRVKDGFLQVPEGAGLGIEVDEKKVLRYASR